MAKNNAYLTDPTLLIQAGIDPKTGLPLAFKDVQVKGDFKKQLRVVDQQNAVGTFQWINLPPGLDEKLIQRVLYYRGQGALFMLEDKFYFLPYTLWSNPKFQNNIDPYGRFLGITPVPFTGPAQANGQQFSNLHLTPVWDVLTPKQIQAITDKKKFIKESAVILWDYTPQFSQTNISRQVLNDPLLDIMAECPALMRTALYNSSGVEGMRVESQNEYSQVYRASSAINHAALTGQKYVPIAGAVEFQELTAGQVAKAEEFLLAMQSLDNYRLGLHGLQNGGLYQKKAHMLESEHEDNQGIASLVLADRLWQRQNFCAIANTVYGFNMWCEPKNVQPQGQDISVQDDFETKEETVNVSEQ